MNEMTHASIHQKKNTDNKQGRTTSACKSTSTKKTTMKQKKKNNEKLQIVLTGFSFIKVHSIFFLYFYSCFFIKGTVGWGGSIPGLDRRSYIQLLPLLSQSFVDLQQSKVSTTSSATTSSTVTTASASTSTTSSTTSSTRVVRRNNNNNKKDDESSSSFKPIAEITDKVFMDIRIARQDGSTYVRDDLDDTLFENRVITARLVIGLFGTEAPNHVEQFLKYIVPPNGDIDIDNPYPSYGRSTFPSLDQGTGLLNGGYIPSLRVKDIGGSTAITYGSRVLPAPLWIEKRNNNNDNDNKKKLSHTVKGLLTHKSLDVTPNFGITTRSSSNIELDDTYTIFGQVIWDETSIELFDILQDLPTYSIERPKFINANGNNENNDSNTSTNANTYNAGSEYVATSVFNAQRDFFRSAAKTFGDTRVDKLYEGKLMRRMEVLRVGKIS